MPQRAPLAFTPVGATNLGVAADEAKCTAEQRAQVLPPLWAAQRVWLRDLSPSSTTVACGWFRSSQNSAMISIQMICMPVGIQVFPIFCLILIGLKN